MGGRRPTAPDRAGMAVLRVAREAHCDADHGKSLIRGGAGCADAMRDVMSASGRFCCKNRGSEERRLRDLVGAARGCGFDAVVMHATQHTSRAPVVVWRPVWRAVVGSVR